MHEKFNYKSLTSISDKAAALGVTLPLSDNLDVLKESVTIRGKTLHNRYVIQPMEGADAAPDGKPSALTYRRYDRFAKSGAGFIWFEAVAVTPTGKALKDQLLMNEKNAEELKKIVAVIKERCYHEYQFYPLIVMQATHSGRYSKPNGTPDPIIAYNNPVFEKENKIDESRIITDDELKQLEEEYEKAFRLCKAAGFDGVDVKCCHRYLVSELLSAYTRKGQYGGRFENRTRFYLNLVERAKAYEDDSFMVTSRLNVYDGFPYPYGFGVNETDGLAPDLTEAKRLVGILHKEYGMALLNVTIGNPYVNPHVNRPYDNGGYVPPEHPLEGLSRMVACCGEIQKNYPELAVVTSGNSYLRQFSPYLAAGAIQNGLGTLAGFGREAFAYPEFACDLQEKGELNPKKCCITCGKCAELLRGGYTTGCVIRDELYGTVYANHINAQRK